MGIQTILFDLDGTLIDTNELIKESFKYTFKQYGYEFTEEQLLSFNGPPLRDTFNKIAPNLVDDMVQTYREHNFLHHDEYVKLFPGVKETLESLQKANIQLGIVSTKMRKGVEKGLSWTGLSSYFSTIITLDEVTHAKPHPEPVLMGMEALHGKKETTLMVGDNSHDIEAGQRAGVATAAVAWSHKGEEFLNAYEPTYMLEKMSDLLQIVGV
ncbi:pyrophosphatase PpaX [Virgibacillus soli]|uniref:pyrophosphatase PpaX n=1 Tax=Paracerasibacillus soli TaxID=480284 RepID=UPI0035ED3315